MPDFVNLGFEINVGEKSYKTAVSRLDKIIEKLEYIYKLEGKKLPTKGGSSTTNVGDPKEEKQVKKNTKALGSYLAKLTSVVVVARKLAHFMGGAIKESANYIENLNLFAVAYGETYQQQLDWALGIAEAYGLANNEVIKFAGTFRELSTSLGLVGNTADLVSETVTKLGYDLSALFNTTVEQAMEKLQSGVFSGNVRPLRAYGIDISQNQIDALFETNEALRQLGVNARNLSQSDKVLARLIITLQSGKDSFGTMAREINNLQSQFRIFQGSLANFRLAIGDLVNKPLSEAMVYINGFIIGITNVIRAFVPLTTEDKTPKFTGITEGAENANEELDKLQGKLASFDKFNVLQQGGSSNSTLATTEALNQLLLEQAGIYEDTLGKALDDINNRAVNFSKNIVGFLLEVDEEGNVLFKDGMPIWTDNAKLIGSALISLGSIIGLKVVDSVLSLVKSLFTLKNATLLLNIALIGGAIYAFVKMYEAIQKGDTGATILAGTIGVLLAGAFIYLHKNAILLAWQGLGKFLIQAILVNTLARGSLLKGILGLSFAFIGLGSAVLGAFAIISNWSDMSNWQKIVGIIGVATTAILGLAMAFGAFHSAWSLGFATAGIVAGISAIIASVATVKKDMGKPISYSAHSFGGYTNANLIMTHENGKREWVGKAAGSSAIVNDTQMSDIMEVAVAKGVYNALSARSDLNGGSTVEQPIIVKIGEQEVFTAVRKTAKKQGLGFANI